MLEVGSSPGTLLITMMFPRIFFYLVTWASDTSYMYTDFSKKSFGWCTELSVCMWFCHLSIAKILLTTLDFCFFLKKKRSWAFELLSFFTVFLQDLRWFLMPSCTYFTSWGVGENAGTITHTCNSSYRGGNKYHRAQASSLLPRAIHPSASFLEEMWWW